MPEAKIKVNRQVRRSIGGRIPASMTNWYDAIEIIPLSRKERMLLDVQNDVQISCRPAMNSRLANSREANASAIFHARRHLGVNRLGLAYPPFAFAFRARVTDHAAGALAIRTTPRNTEKALLIPYLPATSASATADWSFAAGAA